MASVSPFLVAVLVVALVLIVLVIVLIAAGRTSTFKSSSSTALSPCTSPPVAPTGVAVTNPQADILALTWNLTASTDEYTAFIGTSPGFALASALATRTSKTNSISFGNLALGTTYYLKVQAANSCGVSGFATELSYNLPFQFPDRFVIANKLSPSQELCDQHSNIVSPSDKCLASRFCNFRDSWAFYSAADKTIRQSDRPTYCLTRTIPTDIYFSPCTGSALQQWAYDAPSTHLCSLSNPAGDCLVAVNQNVDGSNLAHGPPTTDALSDWIFKPV